MEGLKRAFLILVLLLLVQVRPVNGAERVIPPTLFGANCEFYEQGFYRGTLSADAFGSRRSEFASLLHSHGLTTIRSPGGYPANLYLSSEEVTRTASVASGSYWLNPNPRAFMYNYYTSLDQMLDFCQTENIELIYQLNMITTFQNNRLQLLIKTTNGSNLIPEATYFDTTMQDYLLESAAADVRLLVQRSLSGTGLPRVRYWEMGNEEYGGPPCLPERYAEIVDAYSRAIKSVDPVAKVLVTLGDNGIVKDPSDGRTWAITLLRRLRALGYGDGETDKKIDYFTLHYPDAGGSIVRNALNLLAAKGFSKSKIAITEFTCGWPEYSEKTPRFKHALDVAEFLVQMAKLPAVELINIHDLMSQNFGVFHYNMRPFGPPDSASYDTSLGYVATPTALTYQLFKPLHGGVVLNNVNGPPVGVEAKVGSSYRGVVVNQGKQPQTYTIRFSALGLPTQEVFIQTMTATDTSAVVADIATDTFMPEDGVVTCPIPPYSVVSMVGNSGLTIMFKKGESIDQYRRGKVQGHQKT